MTNLIGKSSIILNVRENVHYKKKNLLVSHKFIFQIVKYLIYKTPEEFNEIETF